MRLVTLNTWGVRGDWSARRQVFQDGFRALDADILTLQETILTDEVDQAAEILWSGYVLAQQRDRESDGQGKPSTGEMGFPDSRAGARIASSRSA